MHRESIMWPSFGFEQNTGAYLSCSAVVDGQMMLFGGRDEYADQAEFKCTRFRSQKSKFWPKTKIFPLKHKKFG